MTENTDHTTPDEIDQHARGLARATNEGLPAAVEQEVGQKARQESAKLIGTLNITDKSDCGRLTMLFKEQAQPEYGLLSMQFDKQGNITMSEAHDAGSRVAAGAINSMKHGANGADIDAQIQQGRNVITQITPSCKL